MRHSNSEAESAIASDTALALDAEGKRKRGRGRLKEGESRGATLRMDFDVRFPSSLSSLRSYASPAPVHRSFPQPACPPLCAGISMTASRGGKARAALLLLPASGRRDRVSLSSLCLSLSSPDSLESVCLCNRHTVKSETQRTARERER